MWNTETLIFRLMVVAAAMAMDCVRLARRMGAKPVRLLYRRTLVTCPRISQAHGADQEGIVFHCSTNSSELVIEDYRLAGSKWVRMRQTDTLAGKRWRKCRTI